MPIGMHMVMMPMMIIRKEQLAAMQRGLDERFAVQLLATLKKEYAERHDIWEREPLLDCVLGKRGSGTGPLLAIWASRKVA